MRFSGTVPLPAAPSAVWPHLTDPATLAASFPGIKSWETLTGVDHFALHISPHVLPKSRAIPPVTIRWETLTPPEQMTITAVITLDQTTFNAHTVLDLAEAGPNSTDLTFTVQILGASSMVETLIRQFAPRAIDTFFKNFIQHLRNV